MRPLGVVSGESLQSELDQERRAKHRAMHELEQLRRSAKAHEQLTNAVIGSADLAQLLRRTLQVFTETGPFDVGVLRLRDGESIRVGATIGVDYDTESAFARPSEAAVSPRVALTELNLDDQAVSEGVRKTGVKRLYCLPLIGQEPVGQLLLGRLSDQTLTDEEEKFFTALSTGAAAVIIHGVEQDKVLQAMRSRDEVLSVVAHDLQNPLNVISIAANTLQQRLPDSSARRLIDRILRGAQRADRLIRDLLEVNAIETGRLTLVKRRVEPADLILSALESQQSLAAEASVIIATDLSPELPPIEADEERLLEVLENLIGNALKFTSAGGSITVGAARDATNAIRISVKDSGSGISPDELPHVFDRFWQAKKTERRGTGLGLTICKGIVEAHGGQIWAQSMLGVGTTLSFTILSTAAQAETAAPPDVANILLVDDRPENLIALKAILDRPDYRLVTASSGEEALGIALRETFSVALIDVAMPGMNGLEIAVHLKELERSRGIPIIFVTAFGNDPEEVHRAYSAGGADYLVKPLDTEIVRKKVAVFVDLSRRRYVKTPNRS